MTQTNAAWPLSTILLLLFGAVLVLMGLYFLLLRPTFLPEDLHYIGASQMQLEASAPQLVSWLMYVFRVLGGYILATGLLVITVAATSFRARDRGAAAGVLVAGLASIGSMTIVNFAIDSDYKWMLLGVALLWASSLGAFYLEIRGGRV